MTTNTALKLTMRIPAANDPSGQIEVSLLASPELANLASIFSDLLIASMTANKAKDATVLAADLYVSRACWEAAIASYSRCFEQGQGVDRKTRTRLDDFVQNLTPELRACHDRVRLLRGKRIGHHVARESGQEISFFFGMEHPDANTIHISEFFVQIESEFYEPELLAQLVELTTLLRDRVGQRIDELRVEIVKKASENLNSVLEAHRLGKPWMPD